MLLSSTCRDLDFPAPFVKHLVSFLMYVLGFCLKLRWLCVCLYLCHSTLNLRKYHSVKPIKIKTGGDMHLTHGYYKIVCFRLYICLMNWMFVFSFLIQEYCAIFMEDILSVGPLKHEWRDEHSKFRCSVTTNHPTGAEQEHRGLAMQLTTPEAFCPLQLWYLRCLTSYYLPTPLYKCSLPTEHNPKF